MPRKVSKEETVRAVSAYQAFATGMRRELCADVPFGESSKVLAAAWKEVSPEARAEWQSKADEETRQRRERRRSEKDDEAVASAAAGPSGAVSKKKKQKRKPTAFLLFSKSYRSTYVAKNPKCEFGAASRACGEAWKALDESEKAKWHAKANEPSEDDEVGDEERRRLDAVVEVAEEDDQRKSDDTDKEVTSGAK